MTIQSFIKLNVLIIDLGSPAGRETKIEMMQKMYFQQRFEKNSKVINEKT